MSDQGRRLVTDGLFGNHRTFILGILGSIAGLTGVIGGFSRGAGILEFLALAGIGILGLSHRGVHPRPGEEAAQDAEATSLDPPLTRERTRLSCLLRTRNRACLGATSPKGEAVGAVLPLRLRGRT